MSTPANDLNRFRVYTSGGHWALPPQLNRWWYRGTVEQCFHRVPRQASERTIEGLLGPCAEFFFVANYEQCVTMYTRSTGQTPRGRYVLYFLRGVHDPDDFMLSRVIQYAGLWTMVGWI